MENVWTRTSSEILVITEPGNTRWHTCASRRKGIFTVDKIMHYLIKPTMIYLNIMEKLLYQTRTTIVPIYIYYHLRDTGWHGENRPLRQRMIIFSLHKTICRWTQDGGTRHIAWGPLHNSSTLLYIVTQKGWAKYKWRWSVLRLFETWASRGLRGYSQPFHWGKSRIRYAKHWPMGLNEW